MLKIFYDEKSIDCEAAVYLIKKQYKEEPTYYCPIESLKENADIIPNISVNDTVFVVGWHGLDNDMFRSLVSSTPEIYWFDSSEKSLEFVSKYPEFRPNSFKLTFTRAKGLVEAGPNVGVTMLVYLEMYTDLHSNTAAKINRCLRKVYDIAPPWIQYLNMTIESERADRFRYAIEKEMNGPEDPKWEQLEGSNSIIELVKWMDRGQDLMEKDQRLAQQQALMDQQGVKATYKAPESWSN